MFVYRTHGLMAATCGAIALMGCTDPEQGTDTRHGGPPEVLAVMVQDDPAGMILETATFCKTQGPADGAQGVGDPKRPELVGTPDGLTHNICPVDPTMGVPELTDAWPSGWYVRIMFDRLLDPSVEDLTEVLDANGQPTGIYSGSIANTHPVNLQCQTALGTTLVDIPYDGYYSPAGNALTWPLGPSIVIKPNFPALVATTKECQVTINTNVVDKEQSKQVYTDQRGPYKFKIGAVSIIAISPTDGGSMVTPVDAIAAGVDLTFNTFVNESTIIAPLNTPDGTESYDFTPNVLNQSVASEDAGNAAAGSPLPEVFLGGDFPVNGSFMWSFKPGAKIKDQCGNLVALPAASVKALSQVSFTTNPFTQSGIAPFDGQMSAPPFKKVKLTFNQYIDPSTVDPTHCDGLGPCATAPTKFSISPTVPNFGVTDTGDGALTFVGDYNPGTMYTFTLNAGTTIKDCPGEEFAFGGTCVTSPTGGTFTNAMDQVIHFKTAALALTSTSPKDNATVTVASPTSSTKISLTFNQDMVASSLATTGWTISPAATLVVSSPAPNIVRLSGVLAPGSYTFTLKGTATILDTRGNSFSPGTDKVIHFTVQSAPPSPVTACY